MRPIVLSLGVLLWSATHAISAELGMEAPALKVGQWIKGGPVDLSAGRGTNVYVVEFWATWCPPCRVSIPHLTALQKKFKDRGVTIIGISNEDAGKVKPFVDRQGEAMNYVVAADAPGAPTSRAYMEAFGATGIPHAFVVDPKGRIVWEGHPMMGLDTALEAVVSGKFDLEAARRASAAAASLPKYFELAAAATEPDGARTLGERILKDGAADANLLNNFAWGILTHPRITKRDLDLAIRVAEAADKTTGGTDASVKDTLARAQFLSGKVESAVATQLKALTLVEEPKAKEQLSKALEEYRAAARAR